MPAKPIPSKGDWAAVAATIKKNTTKKRRGPSAETTDKAKPATHTR
jgi:hypothetical protein